MHSARGAKIRRGLRLCAPAVVVAAVLAACAPALPQREGDSARLPVPATRFEVAGRLSARHGSEAFAGGFRWLHEDGRDELSLLSPTGQTVALLSGDGQSVRLQASDGRILTAGDWAELTERGLGWRLPVDGLACWIQGAPRPGTPFAVEAGEGGHAAVLRQDGWTIVYQAYAPAADAARPARLTLSYPEVELRLAVDNWR